MDTSWYHCLVTTFFLLTLADVSYGEDLCALPPQVHVNTSTSNNTLVLFKLTAENAEDCLQLCCEIGSCSGALFTPSKTSCDLLQCPTKTPCSGHSTTGVILYLLQNPNQNQDSQKHARQLSGEEGNTTPISSAGQTPLPENADSTTTTVPENAGSTTTQQPDNAGSTTTQPDNAGSTTTQPDNAGSTTTQPNNAGSTTTTVPDNADTKTTSLPENIDTTTTSLPDNTLTITTSATTTLPPATDNLLSTTEVAGDTPAPTTFTSSTVSPSLTTPPVGALPPGVTEQTEDTTAQPTAEQMASNTTGTVSTILTTTEESVSQPTNSEPNATSQALVTASSSNYGADNDTTKIIPGGSVTPSPSNGTTVSVGSSAVLTETTVATSQENSSDVTPTSSGSTPANTTASSVSSEAITPSSISQSATVALSNQSEGVETPLTPITTPNNPIGIDTGTIPTLPFSNETGTPEMTTESIATTTPLLSANDTLKDIGIEASDRAMSAALIAALSFGILFFAAVVVLLSKRVYDGWQRRHYSRVDYLVNGMYN